MAIFATFIGVNRYSDPLIRELSGAKNDAVAFCALFMDSISNINTRLLVGVDATVQNIKDVLEEGITLAREEDTLIIFYSGHGSHDHRITGFDTQLSNLEGSTISMDSLATIFKESKAKNVLIILDCCFSGGAPAKVLEDSPVPRDIENPLAKFSGEGRIIIAASNFDQPSYELPSTGHGILTKAIMDVLQASTPTVNLLNAMNDIMEIVRSEANRIGVTQTPVLLNYVTGGLTLPSLKQGKHFFSAFPQHKGIKITNNIGDLISFGLPFNLIEQWKELFKQGLNDLQLEAINEYRILDGESTLVIAPTSSGKTFIGELSSAKAILEGKKSVFLFPYKALVNEKFDQFSEFYGQQSGYRIIRCTGDYLDQNDRFIKGKYDIALFTYEMFLNLSVAIPAVLFHIGLVVLDEGQFITDPLRGISVELLLTNLISARGRGIKPQLLILSAVIGNSNNFEDWLGCRKLLTTKRPVPLIEGVLGRNGVFKFKSETGEIKSEQLLPYGAIRQRRDKPSQQDVIVPLAKKLVDSGEKVIIFRNQRGNAEGCAKYLASDLGLTPAKEELSRLPKHMSSSSSQRLRECFLGGTTFHNSNLSRVERAIVERVYRDPESKIRVLAATTTVAAGINTPASTVILAEQEFRGEDGRLFTVAEYKNMAGRAGRLGFNETGKSIILADTDHNPDLLFGRYVLGNPEGLVSSFDVSQLETWIIRLLAQVKQVNKDELIILLANTYGGYIANRRNPDWSNQMSYTISSLYDQMKRLEILEEENGIVHLTLLGRICGESVLSFRSAMRLVDLLKQYQKSTLIGLDLMALVQALPESDESYIPMFKKGTSESLRPRETATRYGGELIRLLQKYTNGDAFIYYGRCKKASILFDWVNGVPTETIEDRFKSRNPMFGNITYGDIRRVADLTRFQLRSAQKIATIIFPGQMLDDVTFENLLKSLEVGIPGVCLDLLNLSYQMSREEYLALFRNGILTTQQLLSYSKETLSSMLESTTIEDVFR